MFFFFMISQEKVKVSLKKFVKIGRPGYKVTKQQDQDTGQHSLLFQVWQPFLHYHLSSIYLFFEIHKLTLLCFKLNFVHNLVAGVVVNHANSSTCYVYLIISKKKNL